MSTTLAEPRPLLLRLHMGVLAVVLALGLAGCSDPPSASPSSAPTRSGDGAEVPVPPDLAEAFTATLDARAAALRGRDEALFLKSIKRSNPGYVTAQRGYFANLAQLPLQELAYDLDRSSMVRSGDE